VHRERLRAGAREGPHHAADDAAVVDRGPLGRRRRRSEVRRIPAEVPPHLHVVADKLADLTIGPFGTRVDEIVGQQNREPTGGMLGPRHAGTRRRRRFSTVHHLHDRVDGVLVDQHTHPLQPGFTTDWSKRRRPFQHCPRRVIGGHDDVRMLLVTDDSNQLVEDRLHVHCVGDTTGHRHCPGDGTVHHRRRPRRPRTVVAEPFDRECIVVDGRR
jgi:hypothetical protein